MNYPGRPVGPYQGAPDMSGENASDENPGRSVEEDEYFLDGVSGPAIKPQQVGGVQKERFSG